MQQLSNRVPAHVPELDPAMLAFVKCHITSFVKWDVLRALTDQVGFWSEPGVLAREIHRPVDKVDSALLELSREGLLEQQGPPDDPIYRLSDGEPTTLVVSRLVSKVTRSQDLRRIVVAHILSAAVA